MGLVDWLRHKLGRNTANQPNTVALYALMRDARIKILDGEYEGAAEALISPLRERGGIEDPAIVDYLIQGLGTAWILSDRYEDSISFFNKHIEKFPDDAEAYHERGCAYWYSGELDRAITDYSRTLELQSEKILALSGRGQVYAEVGSPEEALQDLNTALELIEAADKSEEASRLWHTEIEAFVRNGKALALGGLGQFTESMKEFEHSLRLSPNNAWAFYNRAVVNEKRGRMDLAYADYSISLEKKQPHLNLIRRRRAEEKLGKVR